ncbi:MAG: hypothetical protein ABSE96_09270 [Terracidiphilus sp.]|jgi:hypothetical protein
MAAFVRAVLFGLLSWFIPLVLSFVLSPLKKSNPQLFSTTMYLIVLVTAGVLVLGYFHKRAMSTHEAVWVGSLWLVMNLIFDFPMFAFGPMKMHPLAYYSEIGIVYVTFPVFGFLAAQLVGHRRH